MSEDVLALTAQIVSAHVTKNTVEVADLPALIRDVFRTLSTLGEAARTRAGGYQASCARCPIGLRHAHHLHGVWKKDDHVETAFDD